MSEPNPDAAFTEIALSSGFLTDAQMQLCREASDQARALGGKAVPLAQVALDRRFLTIQQIEHVEQVMMERGGRPRLGGLELLDRIGSGSMGMVYKARQVGLDRVVAVKVLNLDLAGDKEFIARFQREARLAAQIWHPKAIQVFDVGFDLGRHYIVMEYVEGVPLSKMLRGHPMDEGWALRVIRDVAEPLAKAHSLGIIHRDIKPGNILVGQDGTARLSDLGLAKSTMGGDELTLTHTGHASGTPYYMSPEQCRGEREPDRRTDIYSLGVTLYLMVCGKLPFDGPTPFVIMHKHVAEPLPDPRSQNPALSRPVAELIRHMTAKKREDRMQTCEEVLVPACIS
jgi:serine/threonine-protein kinase